MMALLGLLAVAGYQNKDKISEMLSGGSNQPGDSSTGGTHPPAAKSFLSDLQNMFGSASAGTTLASGLSSLIARFKQAGQSETADSWVGKGANVALDHGALEQALGEETIVELTHKTGLSRSDLLQRLAANIPSTVDRYTPQGRLPSEQEAANFA